MRRQVLGLAAAALLLSGCGANVGSDPAPRATSLRFHQAVAAKNGAAACALLAPETVHELESSQQTTCAKAVVDADIGSGTRATAAEVWGDEALIRLDGDTVFLARFKAGWRITAAGCKTQGDKPYDCELQGG